MNKIILTSILVQILIYCFVTFGKCEDNQRDSGTIAQDNVDGAQRSLDPNAKSGNYFGYPDFSCRRRLGYGGWGNGPWFGGGYGRQFGAYGTLIQKMNGIDVTQSSNKTQNQFV